MNFFIDILITHLRKIIKQVPGDLNKRLNYKKQLSNYFCRLSLWQT